MKEKIKKILTGTLIGAITFPTIAMNDTSVFSFLIKNEGVFCLLETILLLIFIYATYKDIKNLGSGIVITRGEISWNYFFTVLGISLIIIEILMELISEIEKIKNYKGIIVLGNLAVFFYLCLINRWFQNEIVKLFTKLKSKRSSLGR